MRLMRCKFVLTLILVVTSPALWAQAEAPAPPDPGEERWGPDIDLFEAEVVEKDRSYSPAEHSAAQQSLRRLRTEAAKLDQLQFELRIAEIAALAKNSHTILLNPSWRAKYNRVAAEFLIADDTLYLARVEQAHQDLAGSMVTTIEGKSWADLNAHWTRWHGGQKGWRHEFIYFFVESPQVLHAAGIAASPDQLRLGLTTPNGESRHLVLQAEMDPNPPTGINALVPAPRVLELSRRELGSSVPLYLRDPDQVFRVEHVEQHDLLYVQFRANTDLTGQQDVTVFLEHVTDLLGAARPKHVVIDQRFNFGGDATTTRDFMQTLPDLVDPAGKIFVITSGRTLSAGIASVGYLKQAALQRVHIVGEPIGDSLEYWAEGELLHLPVSGINLLFARERHNYRHGCSEPDCHANMQRHPIRIDSLDPDYPVALTFNDFANNRDPALDKVFALLDH